MDKEVNIYHNNFINNKESEKLTKCERQKLISSLQTLRKNINVLIPSAMV